MKTCILRIALATLSLIGTLPAQAPRLINYQGRIAVGGTNYEGEGKFKFALVNRTNVNANWRNDGIAGAVGEPTTSIPLPVVSGRTCTVTSHHDLSSPSPWLPLSHDSISFQNGDERTVIDTSAQATPRRFYRVEVQLLPALPSD